MNKKVLSALTITLAITGITFWLLLQVLRVTDHTYFDVFGILLFILPLLASILGFLTSQEWGGFSSNVGKSLIFLSISLLMWTLGQGLYLYYGLTTGDVPYPGLPDVFFVLMDPFYALSIIFMMKYSGAKSNLKKSWAFLLLLLIPIGSAYLNYVIFFGDSSYFEVIDAAVIVDLVYTFGSILLMSLLTLLLVLSANKLGGKMRSALYIIFLGFVFQYIGDIAFSFVTDSDQLNGNMGDFLFFISISLMAFGLTKFSTKVFNNGNNTNAA